MSALWTSKDLEQATGGRITSPIAAMGVSIDTRTLKNGDLFIALTDVRDGHDFVAAALEKGAAGALVSRIPEGLPADARLCVVDDVMAALEGMGRFARGRLSGKVVAITGSAGKTSTKDMLLAVLSKQGTVAGSQASYNNHWGVPLTLARTQKNVDFAVIEIGMNHPGEIAPLSKMAMPDVAVVTTVALAHLAAFSGIEDIAREKASIFEGLKPNGISIVNLDANPSEILTDAASKARLTFGTQDPADFRALSIDVKNDCTVVQANTPSGPLLFKIGTQGSHFAMNALAVLAAVQAVGGDVVVAATDLGAWSPPAGRGQRQMISLDASDDRMYFTLIDDAYNANPASVAAGLEVLAATTPHDGIGRVDSGRRIAVLGDMLELGEDEARIHAEIADLGALKQIEVVHCVGPLMRNLYEALDEEKRGLWVETADELNRIVSTLVSAGDVVMIKGSKSSYVSRVVDAIKKLGHGRES